MSKPHKKGLAAEAEHASEHVVLGDNAAQLSGVDTQDRALFTALHRAQAVSNWNKRHPPLRPPQRWTRPPSQAPDLPLPHHPPFSHHQSAQDGPAATRSVAVSELSATPASWSSAHATVSSSPTHSMRRQLDDHLVGPHLSPPPRTPLPTPSSSALCLDGSSRSSRRTHQGRGQHEEAEASFGPPLSRDNSRIPYHDGAPIFGESKATRRSVRLPLIDPRRPLLDSFPSPVAGEGFIRS